MDTSVRPGSLGDQGWDWLSEDKRELKERIDLIGY
jgi:hypothetical protein